MELPVRIALLGYGPVARELVTLVTERSRDLVRRHSVEVTVAAIRTSTQEVLIGAAGVPPRETWAPAGDLADFLAASTATIVVQAIPSTDSLVDTATAQVLAAFCAGMDVVTATKSHLVRDWNELAEAAARADCRIRVSAATGAALPAADVARVSLRGLPCLRIRGSLNGTASFVLEQMAGGSSLREAVSLAQSKGIAEADPSSDLDGRDAASKVVLLANLLWDLRVSIDQVEREPITESTGARAELASRQGRRLRSVAVAQARTRKVEVRLEALDPGDPLYPLDGPEKAVAFDCGAVGQIVISGGRSSPRGAAHALLKDVLNIALDGGPAGFN